MRAGGDERLARDLAAEDALAVLVGADAAEDVDLDRLEVEQLDERVDGLLRHRTRSLSCDAMVTGRAFPDGFRWGTATAAHQIEGGNWNNDWWQWERTPGSGCTEPSGDCCDSWHRWGEDVALVADLGLDNYRFSIEWSRIEPEEGDVVDCLGRRATAALCEALLERGVDPVVTFHHFTTPRWVAGAAVGKTRRPPTCSPASVRVRRASWAT